MMVRDLGALVVDADEAAHAVYEPGTPGFAAVVLEFGDGIVRDGSIDRQRLGELVFTDADARRRLTEAQFYCNMQLRSRCGGAMFRRA